MKEWSYTSTPPYGPYGLHRASVCTKLVLFTRLYRNARSTKHKILQGLYMYVYTCHASFMGCIDYMFETYLHVIVAFTWCEHTLFLNAQHLHVVVHKYKRKFSCVFNLIHIFFVVFFFYQVYKSPNLALHCATYFDSVISPSYLQH